MSTIFSLFKRVIVLVFAMFLFGINSFAQTVTNGDFESWTGGVPDAWTLNSQGTDAVIYSQGVSEGITGDALEIIAHSDVTDYDGNFYTDVTDIEAGNYYDVSVSIKSNDDLIKIRYYGLQWLNASDNPIGSAIYEFSTNPDTEDTWLEFALSQNPLLAPTGAVKLRVNFRVFNNSTANWDVSSILLDDFTVVEHAFIDPGRTETDVTQDPGQTGGLLNYVFDPGTYTAEITQDPGEKVPWVIEESGVPPYSGNWVGVAIDFPDGYDGSNDLVALYIDGSEVDGPFLSAEEIAAGEIWYYFEMNLLPDASHTITIEWPGDYAPETFYINATGLDLEDTPSVQEAIDNTSMVITPEQQTNNPGTDITNIVTCTFPVFNVDFPNYLYADMLIEFNQAMPAGVNISVEVGGFAFGDFTTVGGETSFWLLDINTGVNREPILNLENSVQEYTFVYSGLTLGNYDITYSVIADEETEFNDPLDWYVFATDNALINITDEVLMNIPLNEPFEDDFTYFDNGTENNVDWIIESTIVFEGTKSVRNAYGASNNNSLVLVGPVDFTSVDNPVMSFSHIAKTEGDFDHCYIEVSIDDGNTWESLPEYTYLGNGIYENPSYNNPTGPCFDEDSYTEWGTYTETPDNTWWKTETFALLDYTNEDNVLIRFRLNSDGSAQRAGWYIDDISLYSEACLPPLNLAINNLNYEGGELSWLAGSANLWNIEIGLPGFTPGNSEELFAFNGVSSNPYTISGLSPETDYRLFIQTDCGVDGTSEWAGPLSFTTLEICPAPTNIELVSATANSLQIGWEQPGGNGTWDLIWGEEGFNMALEGTSISDFSTNPVLIEGLSPQTEYDFYIRSDCGTGVNSEWVGPNTFTTECGVFSVPLVENFDTWGTGSDAFPDCWQRPVTYGSSTIYPSIVNYYSSPSSPNCLRFQSATTEPTYVITPAFDEDINSLMVSFNLKREGTSSGTIQVGVMSNPNNLSTFEVVQTIDNTSTDWNYYEVMFDETSLSGINNYIAFRHNSNASYYYYWLDDVEVDLIPSCMYPTDLFVDNITGVSAMVNWTEQGTATEWDLLWGEAGFNVETEGTQVSDINTNPYLIEGLSTQTEYDVYVRANCGEGNYSEWVGPIIFITACDVFSTPFFEDFENIGLTPECWNNYSSGTEVWQFSTSSGSNYTAPNDHTSGTGYFAWVDDSESPHSTDVTLETPWIDISSLSYPTLSFWFYSNNSSNQNYMTLRVNIWNGTDYDMNVFAFSGQTTGWQEFTVPLGAYLSVGTIKIQFVGDETSSGTDFYNDISLDDILIDEGASCPIPTAVNVNIVNETIVDIEWLENGSATEWEILWGEAGFDPDTEGTLVTEINSIPYTLDVGIDDATYSVYVRSKCGEGDYSDWSMSSSFYIPPIGTIQIGDGTITSSSLPINAFYGYSYSQSIYYAEDFNNPGDNLMIDKIWYNYTWATSGDPDNEDWIIYMGTTENTALTDWVDISEFTEVFNGQSGLQYVSGTGWIEFTLDQPFIYNPDTDGNLIIAVEENSPSYSSSSDEFFVTDANSNVSIRYYSDGTNPDPYNLTVTGTLVNAFPNTRFSFIDMGSCAPPFNLAYGSLTETTAEITWSSFAGIPFYNIVYGQVGFNPDTEGTIVENIDNTTYLIEALTPGATYDVYVRSDCGSGDVSDWVGPVQFSTVPTCDPPSNVYVDDVDMDNANVYYTAEGTATEWDILYGPEGFDPFSEGTLVDNTTDNPFNISGLDATTSYDVYVRSDCAGDLSPWVGPATFTTLICDLASQCDFTINLQDSYGDGWNGAYLEVYQSGILVETNITLSSGSSATLTGSFCDGTFTEVVFYGGNFDGEVSFNIVAPYGTTLYTSTAGDFSSTQDGTVVFSLWTHCTEPTCPEPSDLEVDAVYSFSADLTWTENGTATAWDLIFGTPGFDPFSEGTITEDVSNPGTVTGLNAETDYEVYVRSDCGGETSYWVGPVILTTLPSCPAPIAFTNEGETPDGINLSWNAVGTETLWNLIYGTPGFDPETEGTTVAGVDVTDYALTGLDPETEYDVYLQADCSAGDLSSLVGPINFTTLPACPEPWDLTATNITANSTELNWIEWGAASLWDILYGESGFDPDTEGTLIEGINVAPYNLEGLDPETEYDVYVRADCNPELSVWVGPTTFTTLPTCPAPVDLIYTNIDGTIITIEWTEIGSAGTWDIIWGPEGFDIATGGTLVESIINMPYDLDVITDGSFYDIYVRANCGGGDISDWSAVLNVEVPYEGLVQIGDEDNTGQHLPIEPFYGYSYSQSIYYAEDFNSPGENQWIEKIWYNYSWSSSNDPDNEDWIIYMGTTANTALTDWVDISEFTEVFNGQSGLQYVSGTGWIEFTLDQPFIYNPDTDGNLIIAVEENSPSYSSSSDEFFVTDANSNVSIRYYSDGTNPDPYNLTVTGTLQDNYPNTRFLFNDIPSCLFPAGIIVENITGHTALVSWNSNGTETTWNVIYGPNGFNPETEGSTEIANDMSFNITGLEPETDYQVYVQADCGGGDLSTLAGPVNFTTDVACPDVVDAELVDATHETITINIVSGGIETEWNVLYGLHGFISGEGTEIIVTENPFTISGLNTDTQYDFYIQANCGVVDGTSNWEGPFVFSTTVPCPDAWNITINDIIYDGGVLSWEHSSAQDTWDIEVGLDGFTPGTGNEEFLFSGVQDNPYIITGLTPETEYDVYIMADCGALGYSNWVGPVDLNTLNPCPDVWDIIVSDIGEYGATVAWSSIYYQDTWNIEVGLPGFTPGNGEEVVQEYGVTDNPFILTGLDPDTEYEVYIMADCDALGESDWVSPSSTFSTIPTCIEPTDVIITNISFESATVSWTPVGSANTWNIEVGLQGFTPFNGEEVVSNTITGDTFWDITGLNNTTSYDVYIQSDCGAGDLSYIGGPYAFITSDPYCNAGPSYTSDSNVEQVDITGENDTEISYTGCPGVTYVQTLTQYSVDVYQGQTYSLAVLFGSCSTGNYSGAGQVWIDWDQNYTYDTEESIGTSSGVPGSAPWNAPVNFDFEVPADAELGVTRMRVMQRESGSLPLDPCATYSWGSVMDFSVNVLPTPPNTEADIIEYSFAEQTAPAIIDAENQTVTVEVAIGTNLSDLIATFTLSEGATATIGGTVQESGITSNDFTNDVVYVVTAEDGTTTLDWTVTVSEEVLNDEADILTYTFGAGVDYQPATIDPVEKTVFVWVNEGTDLTSLVAEFTLSDGANASIAGTPQVSGETENDFSMPITYLVTAEDEVTSNEWEVTVSIWSGIDAENGITNLNLYPNPSDGIINLSLINYSDEFTYTISDVEGRAIITNKVNVKGKFTETIDLDVAAGSYYITIENDKFKRTQKFIIKR
ncbi:MAG TPA: fibronectin type III domain-containing protein [Bacteroidales bacterium]|nr:fibronectin type III domain-containing protein [Bacteroidales bacterium]